MLPLGNLVSTPTTSEEYELSDAGTDIKIEFVGVVSGKDTAYVIYDDSWYQ